MNNVQSVLLKLISKSQFGSPDNICFDGVNMDDLYTEALQQSVLSIVAPEIPSQYRTKKWNEIQFQQKKNFILYCHAQDELKKILDENKISFVVLKGNASAIAYKDPSQRMMGDIDVLVPQDQYLNVKKILQSADYIERHDNGRHASFNNDKQVFEIHHHYSYEIDIEEFLIDGLKNRDFVSIEGYEFPMLPKLANGLVILDHFRRHLKSSVGLRQVVDWMMYVNCHLDDEFWINDFQGVATDKTMYTLAITLTRMCQLYLGLPDSINWCNEADEYLCSLLLENVLNSGNFGRKLGSDKLYENVGVSFYSEGFFHRLQHAGEKNWKLYHAHRYLKPFCWLYQFFRYFTLCLFSGRSLKEINEIRSLSKSHFDLLKSLHIE